MKNNDAPLVSIGMPVYNGEKQLRQALDSLLAQDFTSFELIISDNASTDSTAEICREYANKDKRINYHSKIENQGPVHNFANVLGLSVGKYFMWAAHDDLWEPYFLSCAVRALEEYPQYSLAFSQLNSIDALGKEVRQYPYALDLPSDDVYQRLKNFLVQEESLGKANLIYGVFKTDALKSLWKLLDVDVWGADMVFVFRALTLGNVHISPKILFHKRLPDNASSGQQDQNTYILNRLKYYMTYIRIIIKLKGLSLQKKILLCNTVISLLIVWVRFLFDHSSLAAKLRV